MWFSRVLIFLLPTVCIASEIVKCSEETFQSRQRIAKLFKKTGSITLLVSIDESSMERAETSKNSFLILINRIIKKNVTIPLTLVHNQFNQSNEGVDIYGSDSNGGFISDGMYSFEEKHSVLMNFSEVYVYSRDYESRTNKFYMFEGCHITDEKNGNIQVEKVSVLLLDTLTNQSQSFLEEFKMKNKAIKMVNFTIGGFKVEGLDVCNYAKFYVTGCKENPKFDPKFLLFIFVPFIIYSIIAVSFWIIEKYFKKRPSNRVVPLSTLRVQSLNNLPNVG